MRTLIIKRTISKKMRCIFTGITKLKQHKMFFSYLEGRLSFIKFLVKDGILLSSFEKGEVPV